MTYITGDIACDVPAGRLQGAAFRKFEDDFVKMLRAAALITAPQVQAARQASASALICNSYLNADTNGISVAQPCARTQELIGGVSTCRIVTPVTWVTS